MQLNLTGIPARLLKSLAALLPGKGTRTNPKRFILRPSSRLRAYRRRRKHLNAISNESRRINRGPRRS
jgi:hypothetical protein